MKKIIGLVAVGVSAFFIMSSTCSSNGAEANKEKVESNIVAFKGAGIDFKSMTLDEALALSNETGKLIFIDAYTSWCGPCKQMAATTFRDKGVGEFFNENFINLKIEMEKSADGPGVAKKYRVRAYPTLLIIDGNGSLVKQTVGMQNVSRLMSFAESAL